MHFSTFVDRFPRNRDALVTLATAPPAFTVDSEAIPGYVFPQFKVAEWPKGAAAVLVEAPGAVGKSAAALATAGALRWPLILAERAQVGSYSLSGLVHDSLGFESDYMSRIARGHSGVVIDSLDEALFRAGTDNFLAFLENVRRVASGGAAEGVERAPSVLLFCRSEAAELIKLSFDEASIPLAELALDFFGRDDAYSFIESYLRQKFEETGKAEYNVFRASETPFRKLRDARVRQIASMLTRDDDVNLSQRWGEVSEFLGYAPVLAALAESMAVLNPNAAKHVNFTATSQNELITKILVSILEREQGKLASNMRDRLTASAAASSGDIDESKLYTLNEQSARLLSKVDSIDLTQTSPVHLPAEVRPIYEAAANQFLSDHPFLRKGKFASVVFSDYVRARAVSNLEITMDLSSEPDLKVGMVGPFFGRFLAELSPDPGQLEVREDHVAAVISSWDQEQELVNSGPSRWGFKIVSLMDEFGMVHCYPFSAGLGGIDTKNYLQFSITGLTGVFPWGSRVRSTTIVTTQGLVLGDRGSHLELGPDVTIFASEIDLQSETLRVNAASSSVQVYAQQIVGNYLQRVDAPQEGFTLITADVPPMLRPYSIARTPSDGSSARSFATLSNYVDLRNILMAFRPSLMGARVHHEFMQNRVIRGSQFRANLLADLENKRMVRQEGQWLYLDTGSLDSLGFSLIDLKGGEPSDPINAYLRTVSLS